MTNFLAFVITLAVSAFFAPLYIKFARKIKLGQNILGYVEEHKDKQGTPTMGGVIFLLPSVIVPLFFLKGDKTLSLLTLGIFLAYGVVGFLDDFIKIKFKRNMGLRAYQKILFQLGIAIIVALFLQKNSALNRVYLPFSREEINLGLFLIPFVILVYLATTNSVNLTDGLDGLAGGVSAVCLAFLAVIISIYVGFNIDNVTTEYILQMGNLSTICFAVCGGIVGFMLFNFYPAKIFMGDTGSLALGGVIATVGLFGGVSLYIIILGFMFVVSAVSVILQVLHFKRTRRRIFKMAPFHHHLQQSGMYETKIVFIYIVISIVLGFLCTSVLGVI